MGRDKGEEEELAGWDGQGLKCEMMDGWWCRGGASGHKAGSAALPFPAKDE
jgi:hypothetical protein